jgi:hypothetical protein
MKKEKEKITPWEYSEEFLTWFQNYPKNKTASRDQLWEAFRAGYSMGYRQGRGVA